MRLFQHSCPACDGLDSAECGGVSRRGALGAIVGLGFAAMAPQAIAQRLGNGGMRSISIRRMQTGEAFEGVYWRDGRYDRDALQRLDWVLRDPGMTEATPMDPRLFDVLNLVRSHLESTDAWEVISGYRAPETNAARARQSRRVSRASLHMSGMACDCRLPGRNSLGIARLAADMQTGGVGLYRRDGFVHLDCGPSRRW
ncbi:DUF882 domain-containing protein [Roseococcus pinisoli]|uniref:Murein endopeptidase K n=1 Tax=Roseococcus pinisoli TaxID=2835040 RepID=A0ABS5QCI8_9PROT|nr:DUF882 domain-containing protein [Roseococcus pinisoli]MBS7811390.1 DUF882 domain-containing protein [Roseococcus pinisoli]